VLTVTGPSLSVANASRPRRRRRHRDGKLRAGSTIDGNAREPL